MIPFNRLSTLLTLLSTSYQINDPLLEYSSFFSAESSFHQLVESFTFILLSHLLLHYYKRNSEAMISRISCQSVRSFQTSRNLFKRIRSPRTQQNVLNVSQHSPLFFPLRKEGLVGNCSLERNCRFFDHLFAK